MRTALVLAVMGLLAQGLVACADTDGACDSDGAGANPDDPVVAEANAALERVRAVFGEAALDPRDAAALDEIGCRGTKRQYALQAHTMAAPFWWAYWASSCAGETPPAMNGVPAGVAGIAFRARCAPEAASGEK